MGRPFSLSRKKWKSVNFDRHIMSTQQLSPNSNGAGISPKSSHTQTISVAVIETPGNLFDTPDNSILLHSCNCEGKWGAGIAGTFREKFPLAYKIYTQHCQTAARTDGLAILGTTLLIPPQEEPLEKEDRAAGRRKGRRQWIGCLFTKLDRGAPIAPFAQVDLLDATAMALKDLTTHYKALPEDSVTNGLYCPMINAGIFRVPWPLTRRQLRATRLPITVLVPFEAQDTQEPGVEAVRSYIDEVCAQREELIKQVKTRARLSGFAACKPLLSQHSTQLQQESEVVRMFTLARDDGEKRSSHRGECNAAGKRPLTESVAGKEGKSTPQKRRRSQ